ncbi:MAG TPA: 50S ribosomal protein L9 [Chloroflexia bacterium]|nr:50S ribosomal protein L9 [Chloroflexia bacterium]
MTQTVQGLGDAGTIKEVADGYARNFLLPKKLAVAATRGSLKQAEAQAEVYARRANKAREELQKSATTIEGKTILIRARVGSENRLYGSITPVDVAEALAAQHGITIDRRKIELDEAIHRVGTYGATADLGGGFSARITVEVAPEVTGAHAKARSEEPASASAAGETATAAAEAAPATEAEAEAQSEANPT